MTKQLISASETLLNKVDNMYKFGTKYNMFPHKEAGRIAQEMYTLEQSIPIIDTPETTDELIKSELKRRLTGEVFSLEQRLSPRHYDYDTIVSMYGIPREDIAGLRDWLLDNKENTHDIIDRLYQAKDIENYELGLAFDIPHVRNQAEEFASVHIKKYHKRLGKMLQELTNVGDFLRDIDAVPSTQARSYFHPLTNTLAIGIPAICFTTEDGNMQIKERELITLYGHEGMGHALNLVITNSNGLPGFLKRPSASTTATAESVAQFYQKRIFEDLKNSPKAQKDLGIHNFEELYKEAKDIAQLQEYQLKLSQYAITVLADKSLGNPYEQSTIEKRIQLLSDVTLDPTYPLNMVEQSRYNYDSQGNLNPQHVGELRYVAQPVTRALEEFAKQGITYEGQGRSIIDQTLLKGLWTPIGFVDNAKLVANNYKNGVQ